MPENHSGIILVLNSGSSSLKFKLFTQPGMEEVASGLVERIGGEAGGAVAVRVAAGGELRRQAPVPDHGAALALMGEVLAGAGCMASVDDLRVVGHRVVHGGERFSAPVLVDEEVLESMEELVPLAPLHNPANIEGIRHALAHAPAAPQVAVFDTAFHHQMPGRASTYALPRSLWRELGVRRYGFHGTSHACVVRRAARLLGRPLDELRLVSLHLGNGASACAVDRGRSVDTSMGLTPLEGLVMGTRGGDMDPAILPFLARERGMDMEELDRMLNKESGLAGLCGDSDMRSIIARAAGGDADAALALEVFCYRIRKYIGAYAAVLGGLDAVIFTGGIGENAPLVREMACQGLDFLGIRVDPEANARRGREPRPISPPDAAAPVLVVPTDEEREIALQALAVIQMTASF